MKLVEYRISGSGIRPEDIIEYLINTLDFKLTLSHVKTDYGTQISCEETLTSNQYTELLTKLKLTSLHFIDNQNYIYN